MTAPAAAQIHRQTLAQLAAQPSRQARNPAQDTRESPSFAAHLERGTSDQLRTVRPLVADRRTPPATSSAAKPDRATLAAPKAVAARETATGKTLPEKRQTPAETRNQTAPAPRTRQSVAEDQTAPADAATPEDIEAAAIAPDSTLPPPALFPALPALAVAAPPLQTGTAERLGAAPQISTASGASTPANAGSIQPASDQPSGTPGTGVSALAAPAATFVLEREAALPGTGLPGTAEVAAAEPAAANTQPGAAQNAARAEPSTFAALTGAADMDPASARKARRDAETLAKNELAAGKASSPVPSAQIAADLAASALPQIQPAAAPLNADPAAPATAQAAEGIGFDALIDSIARARDGAATEGTSVAMRHAEFGRISLRFHAEADGLSVAMTSADPTFAPAVAAARAAEAAAVAETAAETSTRTSTASTKDSDLGGGSQAQNGAQGSAGQQRLPGSPARSTPQSTQVGAEALADDGRGGIFA